MSNGRVGLSIGLVFAVLALALACGPCWSAPAEPVGETITDVIIGHNNKGPYTISWTEINTSGIVAVINGRTLRGSDFAIDNAKGIVSFKSVLLQDAIVRMTYRTTAKSKPTGGAVSVPVTVNLLSGDKRNLQVTGLHVQTDPKNPEAAKTIVGLANEEKWKTGKVNSQLLLSQQNDAQASQQGSGMDRSAIKLGGETRSGNIKLTGSMQRIGAEFGGQKEYGVVAGREESAFGIQLTPGKRFEASASMMTKEETAGANKGSSTVVQEQKLAVSATDTTKVSMAHTTTDSQTGANTGTLTETSTVGLDQKIGSATSASVSLQNTSVNIGGKTEATTSQGVTVSSKPSDRLGVTTQVQQQNSDTRGEEVKTSTTVQAKPIDQLSVSASHTTLQSTKTGAATDTSVSFQARPVGNTEVKGTVVEKNARDVTQFQRDFSVTSSPTKYARFSAIFSQKGINDNQDMTKGANIELTPLSHTKLNAGYKYMRTGVQIMTIADYSAASKPFNFLELSGSYRDREAGQEFAPDSTAMQVAISPFDFLSLCGSYQANPEATGGVVQQYQATTAGVKVRVGKIGLTADMSQKNEYKLLRRSEERGLGMEVAAFGRGLFTSGYRTARLFGTTAVGTDTYSVGYRHDLGEAFNLSLSGKYTDPQGRSTSKAGTYDAQASLGVKF